jgi:tetratricopeptide (TPR) repeat protein/predicted aspartyl protease
LNNKSEGTLMDRRTLNRTKLFLGLLALQALVSVAATEPCKLVALSEIPVTMDGLRPVVVAQINGTDARFSLDSGAFWSMLSRASAEQFQLPLDHTRLPVGFSIVGIGGRADAAVTTIKDFRLLNIPIRNADFIVGGGEAGYDTVGLLGQNILRIGDVEYDLAHGLIRFFRVEGCKNANLAYWAKNGDPYSLMDIEWATPGRPHTIGKAYLNGAKIRVAFDTGSPLSMVGLHAAARAGVKPDGPGTTPAGFARGVGSGAVPTWIANFASLKIGDEEVRNARLRFGDIGIDFDMLLGADFFLSHRIYVANSQKRLYFTYSGGPVFDLRASRGAATASAAPAPQVPAGASSPSTDAPADSTGGVDKPSSPTPAAASASAPGEPDPVDASGFARRGEAFAARRDFEHALQDLTRACELAPNEADYFYHRGLVRAAYRQADLALGDFDQTLKLKPDHVEALVSRAILHVRNHAFDEAVADLDAADRLSPKQADIHLRLAALYQDTEHWSAAVAQYNLWIPVHVDDARMAEALNGRCWTRALWGQELDQALSDCNAAVRRLPFAAPALDSRGLVFLRTAKLDKAIADYDASLRLRPKNAWSLYGRGVAKVRKGMTTEGHADIDAAAALAPQLPDRAKRLGIAP